ncbi:exopolyphosphatase [Lactobacillus selangorensis]|uniref:Exopolyphosphatase n=1 Tax=Lactobacillus selangorensis TaxID=81857 RepID=A0A0R2FSV6_9LACO|nr:hypothetical protein [Lactobacillus selangorensis]KRN27931.1 exopolyphosphatase [Lactobacillus selangorensis]KRN30598.1 exopolyphosphatase [Lactobacillus selangorensis]
MAKKVDYGVIVIGAQSVYCSIINLKTLQELERVEYEVSIGDDVFARHEIQIETVDTVIEALTACQRLLKDYGLKPDRVVATNAFHEAANAEYVRNQIYVRTGLEIEWINPSQEALYRNQAAAVYLPKFNEIVKDGTLLLDVSSGNVELTAYTGGQFIFSRNLKIGPLRIEEVMQDVKRLAPNYIEILRDYIDSQINEFKRMLPDSLKFDNIILMGSSISIFENAIPNKKMATKVTGTRVKGLYEEILHASDQYLIEHYHVSADKVPQVLPTVVMLNELLELLKVKTVYLSQLKLIDGVAVNAAVQNGKKIGSWDSDAETIRSAVNLSNRYHVDPKHRDSTVKFALTLFDRLKKIHGLGKKERLLLHIAALVNDVGSYVDNHNHYFHSDYIIRASKIVGLSSTAQLMVAAIARYHSTDTPSAELDRFDQLPIDKRMTIAKLTAILRLADALDASRQQKITKISVSVRDPQVIVTATAKENFELEKWTFQRKGKFFEEVYGLQPILKGKGRL